MDKYADDTYLIIPASNSQSCADEIAPVEKWARENNLSLNRTKSVEIVFVSPRSKRDLVIPPPAVPEIGRVESLKVLGVTFSRKFSVSQHIDNVLGACAQTLFAIRTLQYHGLPKDAIYAVYQAVVVAKLTYAPPVWFGFTIVRLIEGVLKRSFVDRSDSNFGQPQRHRSTQFVIRPILNCLTIFCVIDNITVPTSSSGA